MATDFSSFLARSYIPEGNFKFAVDYERSDERAKAAKVEPMTREQIEKVSLFSDSLQVSNEIVSDIFNRAAT